LRKKEEERRGRKGDGRWEETGDRRREKGDVENLSSPRTQNPRF
jgi:hypothetical protein